MSFALNSSNLHVPTTAPLAVRLSHANAKQPGAHETHNHPIR